MCSTPASLPLALATASPQASPQAAPTAEAQSFFGGSAPADNGCMVRPRRARILADNGSIAAAVVAVELPGTFPGTLALEQWLGRRLAPPRPVVLGWIQHWLLPPVLTWLRPPAQGAEVPAASSGDTLAATGLAVAVGIPAADKAAARPVWAGAATSPGTKAIARNNAISNPVRESGA